MSETFYALLPDRAVIRVSGPDRVSFLQGLVSNNIETISPEKSGYGALLTPQGKFLFDFFVYHQDEDSLLIECERGENGERAAELFKKLRMYKLRAKAELSDISDSYNVMAVFGKDALSSLSLAATPGSTAHMADGIKAVDPRLAEMGARVLLPKNALAEMGAIGAQESDVETYHQMRVSLGIPNGSEEMEVEKSILLESGFEELGGVDFKKGCYMGQELTARTKYRGLVRKRLLPVKIDGPAPSVGTPIMNGDKEAGIIRSVHGDFGLALIRLERIEGDAELLAGDAKVTVSVPDWVQLPENAA
ncbi:folate-binding protein [Thalassospira sp.]|uniref:CAF17-like 4Fe-4S cluster assembly/insertion protein YgfZ n=1 Tax=Thalassospira sp. TaxID=1912094 RepID=UPI000C4243EC|nr:folate-binding protein [Thalassospira sp.]MBC06409.1 aminomethyltransferase [Thalassospira sp.]|tara:strand:+ start:7256 stop:8170 length:915 start_codon:yes stop_codon:yes gene_type:complete